MVDGFYKVQFGIPGDSGAGVIVLKDGQVRGGDSIIYYIGTYSVDGDNITAEVRTDAHSTLPGMSNIFSKDRVAISLTGKIAGSTIEFQGVAKEAPDKPFRAMLSRISD